MGKSSQYQKKNNRKGLACMLAFSDLKTGIRKVWPSAAVMTVLYIGYWIIMMATEGHAAPADRLPVLYLAALFFSFSVPASAYGYINDPSDGTGYVMLPLPSLVKFGVMMLVSVLVIPFGFYLAMYLIDCCLTLAGGEKGFAGMIWEEGGTDFISFWSDYGKICLYQSAFILGNIVLRKHKIVLTVIAMLALHGIFMGIFRIEEMRGGILYILYAFVTPVSIWVASYLAFRRLQFS